MRDNEFVVYKNTKRTDARGSSIKIMPINHENVTFQPLETMKITSKKGVIRGLHFQKGFGQSRMLSLVSGRLFVAAAVIDSTSDLLGKVYTTVLENDTDSVLISSNCAVGTMALEESIFLCTFGENEYVPGNDAGIIWDDSDLNIPWPKENDLEYIVSSKDGSWSTFSEYKKGL